MAGKKNRTQLYTLFDTGAIPSGEDFQDFIDSVLNINDDGIERPTGANVPLKIVAHGSEENLLDFYAGDTHTWRINQQPANADPGLNFSTGGLSKLFVANGTGNVGIGNTAPAAKLHIQQDSNTQAALRIDDAVNDAPPLVVDAKGKVGIGTTSPKSKLQVKQDKPPEVTSQQNESAKVEYIGRFYDHDEAKGIGIGADRIEAIGTDNEQGIQFIPNELGTLTLDGNTVVSQSLTVGEISANNYQNIGADNNNLIVKGQLTAGGGGAIYTLGVGYAPPTQGEGMLTVSGNVGIGTTRPSIHLAIGDDNTGFKQQGTGNLAIYTGNVEHVRIDSAGNVGIGTNEPRSALDTGKGVMTGAANDYIKAQFTLSGGGIVTWGGPGQRLKWTESFVAISMESSATFPSGRVSISQPTGGVPKENVYDGNARSATTAGVVLKAWEALYAVHTVGGSDIAINNFHIVRNDNAFSAPSNWILVAVVNGNNETLKLGTGTILSKNASSTNGSPIPTGVIMMWHGAANLIPDGWALCNGENGTPDLLDRFIVAAGKGYAPGTYGEPDVHTHTHTHTIDPPDIDLRTNRAADHTHKFPKKWFNNTFSKKSGGTQFIDRNNEDLGDGDKDGSSSTQPSGGHTHIATVKIDPFGSGDNIDQFDNGSSSSLNRPKWFALCFIMKL